MATKSRGNQRRSKRKEYRKRLRERQRKRGNSVLGAARRRARLDRLQPQAWEGEPAEDAAVFDDKALASLPSDLAHQVSAVRDALALACQSRGDDALKQVSLIPRNSPLSEWRLFLRGLVGWTASDVEAAGTAWQRLDPLRRPGRMAVALMVALRTDLDRVSLAQLPPQDSVHGDWCSRLDRALLYHAKLLRRVRFDRSAIRIAEVGLRAPEESRELLLGPKKVRWLRDFATEHRSTEPALVNALEQVALHRAFCQPYSDVFDLAVAAFNGPSHDRRNSLLSFFYYSQFESNLPVDKYLTKYLEVDLPNNEELSDPLRQAIACQIHLNEAASMIGPAGPSFLKRVFGGSGDRRGIEAHFNAAASACPTSRDAYRRHVKWIESERPDYLNKGERESFDKRIAAVMKKWSRALPRDIEPRLWLTDYFLEIEDTKAAKAHVQWLAGARQEDPRVRAVPWKWRLLEAMRLCRRKAWLASVPSLLDEAESIWPTWLSKQWLHYLRAAWWLRCNEKVEFARCHQQLCLETDTQPGSLVDACMMLAAAQRMRVGAADLKPLREPVDAAVAKLDRLPFEHLRDAAAFFWDLRRAGMLYPAYRMHGGKFVKEMSARLEDAPGLVLNSLDDQRVQAVAYLCAAHRLWDDGYQVRLPSWWVAPSVGRHAAFAAAQLSVCLQVRWLPKGLAPVGALLRDAARSETDPYYRYWFVSLADELDERLAQKSNSFFGFPFSAFDVDKDDDELEHDDEIDLEGS